MTGRPNPDSSPNKRVLGGVSIASILIIGAIVAWNAMMHSGGSPANAPVSFVPAVTAVKAIPTDTTNITNITSAPSVTDEWKPSGWLYRNQKQDVPAIVHPSGKANSQPQEQWPPELPTRDTFSSKAAVPTAPSAVTHYRISSPPANDSKLKEFQWSPWPVSVVEITDKRTRIAKGEQLYKRVIIKKPVSYFPGISGTQ